MNPHTATPPARETPGRQSQIGASPLRNEDRRLLTGEALFVDDVHLEGMLHATFVRSDYAHGILKEVDLSAALEHPGVVAAYAAKDLGDYWEPGPLLVPPPPIDDLEFHSATQVPLARDKVRHVGEPIAVIVARSRYEAEDAAALVEVDIDPLPVVSDLAKGLEPDAPRIHEQLDSNQAAHVIQQKGNWEEARARAHRVIKRRFLYDRGASAPLENRGVVANWDARSRELTVWDTTQAPIPIRNGLAAMLGLPQSEVRVIAPFIGGGGNFATQTIDFTCQRCDRRLLEQNTQTDIHTKLIAQSSQQARRGQRVATCGEKIIVATDTLNAEHATPDCRNGDLCVARGSGPGRRGVAA